MISNPQHKPLKVDPTMITDGSRTNHALAPGGLQILASALLPLIGQRGRLPAPLGVTPGQVDLSEARLRMLLGGTNKGYNE